ncbi:hypothetical protein C1H46_036417 [Malus baccata]|uniref:Uncharacterized protein n=1 Tax=Malus baccata TaxID=106549 RepID=A0A540KUX5_MALBA|nr:hypothetical protein C1H46_036417 [Malus baccata]
MHIAINKRQSAREKPTTCGVGDTRAKYNTRTLYTNSTKNMAEKTSKEGPWKGIPTRFEELGKPKGKIGRTSSRWTGRRK